MSGFFFANLWGLLALGSLLAVVAAYLFYRRYPPRRVTGLFLWGDPARQMAGGRTFERPRFGRSFWLDFFAALLCALAVAGPAWLLRSGNLPVVILDDSFSMQARDNHLTARALAVALLAQADRPGAVILAGTQPQLLCHPETPGGEMAQRLGQYLPAQPAGDLAAALRSAAELYNQPLDLHFITDQDFTASVRAGDTVVVHRLPGRGDNLAFGALWRARSGEEDFIHARIVNFSAQPATVAYTLRALAADAVEEEARVVFSKTLELAPGAGADCEASVRGGAGLVLAQLHAAHGADVIAADSRAWLLPPPPQTITYGVAGLEAESARYVRLALDAAGAAQLDVRVPAAASPPAPVPSALSPLAPPALLVTSDSAQRGSVLTLELPAPVGPVTFSPPFVVDLAEPLCRDVHLGAGYWTVPLDQPKIGRGSWLIFAGMHPLFWRAGEDRYVLNMIPQKSSIVTTPAWPALFANLVALARERLPGLRKTAYAPGQGVEYRPVVAVASGNRQQEPGALQLFAGDTLLTSAPARGYLRLPFVAGRYDLRQDGAYKGSLSVLPLYGEESDTRALAAIRRDLSGGGAEGEAGRSARVLFWLPLLLGAGLLLLNWRLGEER